MPGLHLPVDHVPLPSVPENLRIFVGDFRQGVFPVEEDECVVVEDGEKIANSWPSSLYGFGSLQSVRNATFAYLKYGKVKFLLLFRRATANFLVSETRES